MRLLLESGARVQSSSINNSSGGYDLLRNDGNRWGYFYADASGIGILHGAGGWAIRANGSINAASNYVTVQVPKLCLNDRSFLKDLGDGWARINQDNEYGNGIYTPYLDRADGGYQVDGNQVIDADAGWHRSYGQTGWYNGTYTGGIYMNDANTFGSNDYTVFDGLLFYDQSKYRLSMKIDNIFDKEYYNGYGQPQKPLSFLFGVNFKI